MSEHEFIDATATETTPPPPVEVKPAEPPKNGKKREKTDKEIDNELGTSIGGHGETKPLKDLRITEDMNLKDIIEQLGQLGAFRIGVSRVDPQEVRDPITGRMLKASGHLKSYDEAVDDEFIAKRHGGGRFELKFTRRNKTGAYVYVAARRIDIAGEPNYEELRGATPLPSTVATAPTSNSEAPSVITKAMEMMERAADRDRAHHNTPVDIGAITAPFEKMIAQLSMQMRERDEAHSKLVSELRTDLAQARSYRAPEDPIKEKLLGSLIDGESGRITGLRVTHESEIRTLKANAIEDEKRLRDSFERDKSSLIAAFDRERQTMLHSHEQSLASARMSFETQIKVLDGHIKHLERNESELRTEVKELRAKKDKSLVETAKELQTVKDALGIQDGDNEKSAFDTIAEVVTDPNAGSLVKSFFRRNEPAAAQQAQQPAQQQASGPPAGGYKRQLVETPDGKKWIMEANGKLTGPVKHKADSKPSEVDLPVIDPERVQMAVTFLERAVENGSDPETVATGARALVPDEVITVLRDHGPDIFMQKVAKIPSNSALASQEGKNWVRKFSKFLVGG